jgi:Major capsid protein Gp23
MNVQSLLESSGQVQSQYSKAKALVKKWEPTGLLKGKDIAKDAYGKERMATILENQAKAIMLESSQTGTGGTFTAGSGEQWAGVALPLVRKVFAEISAKEFLSIQPMTMPSGLVFFLEFKYGTDQPGGTGLSSTRFNSTDSLYGTTNQKDVDPFGGLYGAGRWGYSLNETSSAATANITTASFADVNFNVVYSASAAAGKLRVLSIPTATSTLSKMDTLGVRSFIVSGSGINETTLYNEFTNYNASTGTLSFVVTASGTFPTSSTVATVVTYTTQTADNSRGDFEDRSDAPLTGSRAIPEFNMDLRSESVTAKTRKLKGKWTQEYSQDLNAYQSIDAEAEITSVMSEFISAEIDLELIDMMIGSANTTDVWSTISNRFYDKTTNTWSDKAAGAGGYYNSQGEWFQTLGTKVQSVARKIHKKTLRGQGNVLMCSPEVATIIESIPGYSADTDGSKEEFAFGGHKAGSINSRYKVIVNPYMQENCILMAYKGGSFLETGAAYCPYIPLIMTPLLYDPETFTPRKGLMSRYAKKLVRPEFFGKIFVADLGIGV